MKGRVLQQDLVVRAQAGDHQAFTALVAISIDGLYRTARLILRSDDRAEEAVQEALLAAWLSIRSLRDPARFEAWVRRLLVNCSYAVARREGRRRIVEIPVDGSAVGSHSDSQAQVAARDQLDRAFQRLSPEQRAVLVVHHYLDLADADAAEALGVRIGTLKSRLHRAMSALREAVEADERRPVYAHEVAR